MAKDLFSDQSKNYALYRPVYPEALFNYIFSFVVEKNSAWDCATGNGQSALSLSQHFKKVFASDISKKQLEEAPRKENIEYVLCAAEQTPFPENSFDLITVSQAYHWLNWEKFHKEVHRVAKHNCVIAVWMYDLPFTNDNEINLLIHHFYKNIAGPYWDAERKHIEEHYANIPFDFKPLPTKEFAIKTQFTPEQLSGYFSSWSATQKFKEANGYSPVDQIKKDLYKIWQAAESKSFRFPLVLKLGTITK